MERRFVISFNPAFYSVISFNKIPLLFHDGGRYHIETSPLISFYMIPASVMKELKSFLNSS